MTFDHHTQLIRSWGLVRPHVFKHQAPTLDQPKPKPNPNLNPIPDGLGMQLQNGVESSLHNQNWRMGGRSPFVRGRISKK